MLAFANEGGGKLIVKVDEIKDGELPINRIILGEALKALKKLPDNSIDAVVTDPPYGLKFMNQKWDYDVPSVELWKEVLRVLKPGGHLLSFFGTRTYHRGVVNIEDAGFEIRDMIQWIYGSGFPKSMDISKAIDKELGMLEEREVIEIKKTHDITSNSYSSWEKSDAEIKIKITAPATYEAKKWYGWGTALKPACEPIVLARKPISEKNIAQNVLKWGTGGLNIHDCRIPIKNGETAILPSKPKGNFLPPKSVESLKDYHENTKGRFPANVILDDEAANLLDEQSGISKTRPRLSADGEKLDKYGVGWGFRRMPHYICDEGGASRFFYCAKAGRNERFAYCRDCDEVISQKEWKNHKGHKVVYHITVKPLKLIEYLVRLVTPPNGIVLDPFFGTGTTGVACLRQGFKFIGVELEENYSKIAEYRLKTHLSQKRLEV